MEILPRYVDVLRKLHVLLCDEKYIDQHVFNGTSYI